MNEKEIREQLYRRYIAPTESARTSYFGIEIEMPIVHLSGDAADHAVAQSAAAAFLRQFGFAPQRYDINGVCFSALDPVTGDTLSFDCGYDNLEFSFGKEESLGPVHQRFQRYITFLNEELGKSNHILTGMGINPNYRANRRDFIPVGRYRMLDGFLQRSRDWKVPMYFHPYPDYATYACASQVQLDITKETLIPALKAFSLLEPVKAVLFNNAWLDREPQLLCVRDLLWENSTHGINPHNIGMYEHVPESTDELLDYISMTSSFCTERDGHYLHFQPIPVIDYLQRETVAGEYYEDGVYHPVTFHPEASDLNYLRSYKFEALTFRGTIEFRSVCTQPFRDAMSVAAFHGGLLRRVDELTGLLEADHSIYHHGFSASELRKIMNRRDWPRFVERDGLRQLCRSVLELAEQGLREAGHGDERYLAPLFERAERLRSPGRQMVEALEAGTPLEALILDYAHLDEASCIPAP